MAKVKSVRVEDAVERNPFRKASVVEVACSFVESLVNGHENVIEPAPPQPVQDVTVRLPIVATLALKFVVEARLETKRLVEVAWSERKVVAVVEARVEEAIERKPPWKLRMLEVACSPEPREKKG